MTQMHVLSDLHCLSRRGPGPFGLVPGAGIGLDKGVICDDRTSYVYCLVNIQGRGGSSPLVVDFH